MQVIMNTLQPDYEFDIDLEYIRLGQGRIMVTPNQWEQTGRQMGRLLNTQTYAQG